MAKNKKPTPITAWSYSRLSCYEECPAKHNYRNIMKLDEPKGDAMFRGIKIHNEAAKFLDGSTARVPESCINFKSEFAELKSFNPIVEQQWAFTKNMRPTSWFAKDCWLRATLDAGLVYRDGWADVIDLKTGKKYDGYEDQLNLFAATMIHMNPTEVTVGVTVRLWYLDLDDHSEAEVVRDITVDEAMDAFEDLTERAETMMAAERFPPRPGWYCGGVRKDGTTWGCHFRKSNGGPCAYG